MTITSPNLQHLQYPGWAEFGSWMHCKVLGRELCYCPGINEGGFSTNLLSLTWSCVLLSPGNTAVMKACSSADCHRVSQTHCMTPINKTIPHSLHTWQAGNMGHWRFHIKTAGVESHGAQANWMWQFLLKTKSNIKIRRRYSANKPHMFHCAGKTAHKGAQLLYSHCLQHFSSALNGRKLSFLLYF